MAGLGYFLSLLPPHRPPSLSLPPCLSVSHLSDRCLSLPDVIYLSGTCIWTLWYVFEPFLTSSIRFPLISASAVSHNSIDNTDTHDSNLLNHCNKIRLYLPIRGEFCFGLISPPLRVAAWPWNIGKLGVYKDRLLTILNDLVMRIQRHPIKPFAYW